MVEYYANRESDVLKSLNLETFRLVNTPKWATVEKTSVKASASDMSLAHVADDDIEPRCVGSVEEVRSNTKKKLRPAYHLG